jgi:asparagine synthase (glutamine-hydrolysing)
MSFADVPLGAFLSGGIDSSAVVAALSRGGRKVNSFTVGFEEREYDERRYASEVARLYGTNHHERLVVPDNVDSAMEKLVWHFDEPFNDYSYLPTFYVCKAARQEITVALSGDGGDELFAGYPKYRRAVLRDDLTRLLPSAVRRGIGWAADALPASSDLRLKVLHQTSDAADMFTHALTLGFMPEHLRRIARGPLAACLDDYSPSDVVRSLLRQAPPEEVGAVNAMRYLDFKLTLAGDILVKVDRASMAVSLEVRPVFLHRDLVAVAARIPPRLLATRHEVKLALKDAVRPWLPESIVTRPKMGFAMPLQSWLADPAASPVDHGAATDLTDEWIDRDALSALVETHTQGANHTSRIHALWFLRQWSSLWLADHERGAVAVAVDMPAAAGDGARYV